MYSYYNGCQRTYTDYYYYNYYNYYDYYNYYNYYFDPGYVRRLDNDGKSNRRL